MKLCSNCKTTYVPKGFGGDLCIKCTLEQPGEANPYYEVKDLAKLWKISPEQVRRNARKGKIPGRIPGIRQCLWSKSKIDNVVKSEKTIEEDLNDLLDH